MSGFPHSHAAGAASLADSQQIEGPGDNKWLQTTLTHAMQKKIA
jgi:hypothetical protein